MERKKPKRQVISLSTKIDILDCLAKGDGPTEIGKQFNLGESTIRTIKKNEDAIRKSVISGTQLSAKVSSYSRDVTLEKMERVLLTWIGKLVKKKAPISKYLIKKKALELYDQTKLSTPDSQNGRGFYASAGWLSGFVRRNELQNIKINGVTESLNEKRTKPTKSAKTIENHTEFDDHLTESFQKRIPDRTRVAKRGKKSVGRKERKDQVTLLLCSGDRALKPRLLKQLLKHRSLRVKELKHRLKQPKVHRMDNKKELENHNDASTSEEIIPPPPLTVKLIREGFRLCQKLENHFLANDPDSERVNKFRRDLMRCMSGYRELYQKLIKSPSQSLITDYFASMCGGNDADESGSQALLSFMSDDSL